MNQLQKEIIFEMGTKPTINPEEEFANRSEFLTNYLMSTGRKGFVLGISGGQDSLLAGYIAQNAVINARKKGLDASFHALLLPYGEQKDREDAVKACSFINPDEVHDFQIKPMVDAFEDTYGKSLGNPLRDYDKGNVKARARMAAQYAVASQFDLLVIGTDHAAEAVTGFFTKHGDGAADVLPLSGLNKRQGRAILRFVNAPEIFITKQPTADLLDNTPGQADETELNIVYDKIDDYLEGKEIDYNAAQTIETRYTTTMHKRALPVAFE